MSAWEQTSDGLPRRGPEPGKCNDLPGEKALVRCDLPEGHFGKHRGSCGWGASEWDAEPRRLIPHSLTPREETKP